MQFTYLLVDIGAVLVPFIFSFHPKLNFHKKWKAFWPACFLSAAIFIIWDIWFTEIGVWGFNPAYLTGIQFFNLPIEEVLFFICIPYACIFTYHCFDVLIGKEKFESQAHIISMVLIVISAAIGITAVPKFYTSFTFIGLAMLLSFVQLYKKASWMGLFYFSYLILIIPFFIVNGILTGTGIDGEVVWYNDLENLGFRLLTIPIEDIFYGMLLILLNAALFEHFKVRLKAT